MASSGEKVFPLLTLVAFPLHNLGDGGGAVFWDLLLLLEDQVATVARRAFAHLRVVSQVHLLLDWEALFTVTYAS